MSPEEKDRLAVLDRRMDTAPASLTSDEIGVYLELCTKRVAEMTAGIPEGAAADELAIPVG